MVHAEVTRVHRVEAARLIDIVRDLDGKLADLVHGRTAGHAGGGGPV